MDLADLASLLATPAAPEDLTPPPRFAEATFATYRVDADVAGQAAAVAAVQAFATAGNGLLSRWFGRGKPGLYLDGSFGVGKTHLLAACWHAAGGTKRYLSFSEAMSLMTMHTPAGAADRLAADLVCIDEFEIDDPTNTRLADLLLGLLVERGARFVTTSNTVVGELGDGRMSVDLFRSQLVRISDAFTGIHVPGRDHRRLKVREGDDPGFWGSEVAVMDGSRVLAIDAHELDAFLAGLPVVNLRRFASAIDGLLVTGLRPFHDQLAALRFVNLVDRLYDWCVPVRIRADFHLDALFPEPPLIHAFHRKHRRCRSRLTELCA